MEKENFVGFLTGRGKPFLILTEEATQRAKAIQVAIDKEVSSDRALENVLEVALEEEFDEAVCSQVQRPKRSLSPTTSNPIASTSHKTPEVRKKSKHNGKSSFKSPRLAEPKPVAVIPESPPCFAARLINQSRPIPPSPLLISSSPVARLQISSPFVDNLSAREMEDIALAADCKFSDDDSFSERGKDEEPVSSTDMFSTPPEKNAATSGARFNNLSAREMEDIALAADCKFTDDDSFSERGKEEPLSGTDMFCTPPEKNMATRGARFNNLTEAELADVEDITGSCLSSLLDEEF